MFATIQLVTLSTLTLMHLPAMDYMVWLPSCPVLAERQGFEPWGRYKRPTVFKTAPLNQTLAPLHLFWLPRMDSNHRPIG